MLRPLRILAYALVVSCLAGSAADAAITITATQTSRTVRPGIDSVEVMRITISNSNLTSETLNSILFENRTNGPGNDAQKDAEWSPLVLVAPSRTFTGSFLNRNLQFSNMNVTLPAGSILGASSVVLTVYGMPSIKARDGDALDFRVKSATASSGVSGAPDPNGEFAINGMTSRELVLKPVTTPTFALGSRQNLALDFVIPANGYSPDQLQRLEIENLGTAQAVTDIANVELWQDDGNGTFDPLADTDLGALAFTGDRWVRAAINLAVPTTGRHVYVTVDIADQGTDGHTVRLGLPSLPDVGLTMSSANDGPNDQPVANPFTHSLAIIDRVTVAAKPIDPGFTHPGDTGVMLFHLVATNSYSVSKQLEAITFTNVTAGLGSIAERDGELQSLTLYDDANADGVADPSDPVLGSALFIGGRASFSGFAWKLQAGSTRHLILTGDVSLLRATDGDALGAGLTGPGELTFTDATSVSASWPLGTDTPWTVDGMRARQVSNLGAPGVSLAPNQGPVRALDVVVRPNGYQPDVLNEVTVVNDLGTAQPADLAELHLWRDGGDGVFSGGGGDDIDLGSLTPSGGTWTSAALAEPLSGDGARLFVSVTVSASPTDSTTVRLALQQNTGLVVQSGNDGPIDEPVANPEDLLISARTLLADLTVTPAATVVGQNVAVRMRVTNTGTQAVLGVAPTPLSFTGGGVSYVSGPAPASATIPGGAFQDYTWTYDAIAPDTARFSGWASGTNVFTGQPVTSLPVTSNPLRIFARVDDIDLEATAALPINVTRGQHDVVSYFFDFAQTTQGGPDVLVRSFRLRLQSESGTGIVPANLLSRVLVSAGSNTYLDRTSLESSGDEMNLVLATPIVVAGTSPVTIGVSFDIDSATTVPNFRVTVPDSTWFTSEDAVSGAPVGVSPPHQSFPFTTGLARVVESATELDIAAQPGAFLHAGQGQADVKLLTLRLTNPGIAGVTADARVNTFAVRLADTMSVTRRFPGAVIQRLRVRNGPQIVADRPVSPNADSILTLVLSPLVSVPVNNPIDIEVFADLSDTASIGAHQLEAADSILFDVRDPTTGNRIPVLYATNPMTGPAFLVEARADSMYARGLPQLPPLLAAGATGVPALSLLLRHPGTPGSADLSLDTLVIRCVDEARNPLVPALYLDRVHVRWNGVEVANLGDPPAVGNAIGVPFPVHSIAPGDVDTLSVALDFLATAPATSFEITVHGSGLPAFDANTFEPAIVATEEGLEFPLPSGLTHVAAPSRTLEAGLTDRMPASLAPDGGETKVAEVTLRNTASAGSGPVVVDRFVLEAADAAKAQVAIGQGASRVRFYLGGSLWAESGALTTDSTVAYLAGAPLSLDPGVPQTLEVRIVPRAGSTLASFRVGFAAADVGIIQPDNPLLVVGVQPPAGEAFPLWTNAASFTAADLETSYSNFPNPFAAGREPTTFSYYLPSPGRVSLRLWSARGERVIALLDEVSRGPGLHQTDLWDGRNGRGTVVTNGVYVAELIVHLDDGTSKRLIRKVAVVR
jgi:hypothetical protein